MDKPFAIVDGQLYINEAMIGDSTVGMVRITDDLLDRFGSDRVIDTPLAESGIVGTAGKRVISSGWSAREKTSPREASPGSSAGSRRSARRAAFPPAACRRSARCCESPRA